MLSGNFCKSCLLFAAVLLQATLSFAEKRFEDTPDWFADHLKIRSYDIDTSASAIVLYEKLSISVLPDHSVLRHGVHVIQVLKKPGVKEADVTLYIYSPRGLNAHFKSIKGAVYNLEGGKPVKQAMDKSAIHYSPYLDDYIAGKFSIPSVREGSIISYEYEVQELSSLEIAQWNFQGSIPKLWSEIQILLPTDLNAIGSIQSKVNFVNFNDIESSASISDLPEAYISSGKHSSESNTVQRWIRRNVSALLKEPYANNIDNYSERIELQMAGLSSFDISGFGRQVNLTSTYHDWRTWSNLNFHLNKSFNEQLDLKSKKLKKLAQEFWQRSTDTLDLAKKIYYFFRDSTEEVNKLVRSIDKNKQDSSKSTLMCAVMRCAGLNVWPVLLGSKDRMKLSANYASLNRMITGRLQVTIGDNIYYLYPYNKYAPFGYIDPRYYNGFSWVLADTGHSFDLSASLLKERTAVQITTLKNDINDYQVSVIKRFGLVSGVRKRAEWNKDSSIIKADITSEIKELPLQGKLLDYRVENLDNPDTTLYIKYTVRLTWPKEKMAYITPSAYSWTTENPFKAQQRHVPVDIPYAVDVTVSLNLRLPEGYVVDEKPESIVMKFDDKNYYKYVSEYNEADRTYLLNTRFLLQKTFFDVPEYAALKEFFDKTIEIQKKNLVLKK